MKDQAGLTHSSWRSQGYVPSILKSLQQVLCFLLPVAEILWGDISRNDKRISNSLVHCPFAINTLRKVRNANIAKTNHISKYPTTFLEIFLALRHPERERRISLPSPRRGTPRAKMRETASGVRCPVQPGMTGRDPSLPLRMTKRTAQDNSSTEDDFYPSETALFLWDVNNF